MPEDLRKNFPTEMSLQDPQDMFINAPIGVFTSTPEGRYISANPALARMYGYDSPEQLIESVTDIAGQVYVDPSERDDFIRLMKEQGEVLNHESRRLRRDGTVFWVSMNSRAVRDEEGRIVACQGFTTDISERKQAEEALVQREKEYREILDNAPIGIFKSVPEGRFISVNPILAQRLGYEDPQKMMESVTDINSEVYVNLHEKEKFKKLIMENGLVENFEFQARHRDGSVIWACMNAKLIQDQNEEVKYYLGFVTDITRQKQMMDRLHEREAFIKTVLDNLPVGVAVNSVDPKVKFTYMNDNLPRFYRTTREALAQQNDFWEVVYQDPEFREKIKKRVLKDIASGDLDRMYWEDVPVSRPGQETFYITAKNIPLPESDLVVSTVWDVTQRKKAEEALREQQQLLTAIFRNVPLVLMVVDSERRVQQVNGFASQFAGRDVEEMIGLRGGEALRCVHALDDPQGCGFGDFCEQCVIRNTVLDTLKTEKTHLQVEAPYYFLKNEDETLELTLLASTTPITFKNKRMALVTLQDITERKKIEKQLKFLSFNDQLTNLYNRTCFEYEMQRLSKSREHPITVVCMDVDGLKMVNDTLGHDQGDKILKHCADLLRDVFRKSDIVARTGGDEFTALLPKTDKQAGQKVVRRIRTVIDGYNQQAKPNQIPLSISIGICVAENADSELSSVFKEADDLMYRDKLSKDVTHRSRIMRSLLAALEERDFMSHDNAQRMDHLCRLVGKKVDLSEKRLSDLALLVHLHDIGNAGVPDHILFKQSHLTEEEWRVIYQHPEKGYRIAKASIDLAEIGDLILKHHERWDGEGYPLGLEGKEIPIECRVFSIIDAYDSMTSQRPYREALAHEDAIAELKRCSGTQFDPDLVEKFIEIIQQ